MSLSHSLEMAWSCIAVLWEDVSIKNSQRYLEHERLQKCEIYNEVVRIKAGAVLNQQQGKFISVKSPRQEI